MALRFKILGGVFGIGVAVALFIFLRHVPRGTLPSPTSSSVSPTSSPLPTPPPPLPSTLPEIQQLLLGKSQITFSEPTATSKKTKADLPEDLKLFVLADAEVKTLAVETLTYDSDKNGFAVAYTVPRSVADAYGAFARSFIPAGWKLLGGYRTDLASQLEVENAAWRVRISQTKISDVKSSVEVKAVSK